MFSSIGRADALQVQRAGLPHLPFGRIGEVDADNTDPRVFHLSQDIADLVDVPVIMRGIPLSVHQERRALVADATADQQVADRDGTFPVRPGLHVCRAAEAAPGACKDRKRQKPRHARFERSFHGEVTGVSV